MRSYLALTKMDFYLNLVNESPESVANIESIDWCSVGLTSRCLTSIDGKGAKHTRHNKNRYNLPNLRNRLLD